MGKSAKTVEKVIWTCKSPETLVNLSLNVWPNSGNIINLELINVLQIGKWRLSNFSGLTILKFANQEKVQDHLQIFSTSLAKWNMGTSFWFCVRPKKYFQLSAWRFRELYGPGS